MYSTCVVISDNVDLQLVRKPLAEELVDTDILCIAVTEEHCEPAACRDSAGTPTGSSTRCSRLFSGAKYRGFLRLMCRMGMVLPFNVVTNAVTSAAENKHTHRLLLLQNAPTHACDHLQKHHAKSPSARARHLALYMWRGRAGRRPVSPRGDCPSEQSTLRRWRCSQGVQRWSTLLESCSSQKTSGGGRS